MELRLIHQPPQAGPLPDGAILWRTCLREVAFVDASSPAGSQPVLTDAAAYALLVEVVSGLRSPLLGETEVQAQFKEFLAALDPVRDRALHRLGQRVLADVKTIRAHHLQGLGAHSYAALAARHVVAGSRVAVLGTGAMATAVIAAIGGGHRIDQWGRRADAGTVSGPANRFLLYDEADSVARVGSTPVSVVVAAPVSARPLADVLALYDAIAVAVDLRPADARAQAPVPGDVVTLDDLFREAGEASELNRDRLEAAHAEISRLAGDYVRRQDVRPFGWDDLWA